MEARVGGEAAGQAQGAGDGGRVGAQPCVGLGFRCGGKLGYGRTSGFGEAGMRATTLAGLLMAGGLSTAGLWATAAGASPAEIGRIKSVAGVAQVVRGKAVLPAAAGQVLQVADVLKTGAGGRIGVTFVDNSRFAVGPNSSIALSAFEFNDTTHAGRSLTTVNRGALAVVSGQIAHENKDAMRVRTPTSLLAARGTRFVVDVGP